LSTLNGGCVVRRKKSLLKTDFEMLASRGVDGAVPSSVRDVGLMEAGVSIELLKDSQLERQERADAQELVEEYRSTECTCRIIELERRESLSSSARRLGIEERSESGCDVAGSGSNSGVLELDPSWRSRAVVTGTAETPSWNTVAALAATIEPSKSNNDGLTSWLSGESSCTWV
jgi:hypothetical protein